MDYRLTLIHDAHRLDAVAMHIAVATHRVHVHTCLAHSTVVVVACIVVTVIEIIIIVT